MPGTDAKTRTPVYKALKEKIGMGNEFTPKHDSHGTGDKFSTNSRSTKSSYGESKKKK